MVVGVPSWVKVVPSVDWYAVKVVSERTTRTQRGKVGAGPFSAAEVAPTVSRLMALITVVVPLGGMAAIRCGELAFRFSRIMTPALPLTLLGLLNEVTRA